MSDKHDTEIECSSEDSLSSSEDSLSPENNQQEESVSLPEQVDTHTMATTAVQISPLDSFDFSNTANWPKWIRRFESFRMASGLIDKPEEYQVNSLLYTLG